MDNVDSFKLYTQNWLETKTLRVILGGKQCWNIRQTLTRNAKKLGNQGNPMPLNPASRWQHCNGRIMTRSKIHKTIFENIYDRTVHLQNRNYKHRVAKRETEEPGHSVLQTVNLVLLTIQHLQCNKLGIARKHWSYKLANCRCQFQFTNNMSWYWESGVNCSATSLANVCGSSCH